MKKGIRCLLLALMMLFMFCVSVAAAEQTEAQLYYVTDAAGLLDENENMQLEKMAETVSQKYGVGVYIVTLEDYQDVYPNDVYKATGRCSATVREVSILSTNTGSRNWKKFSWTISEKTTGMVVLRTISKNAVPIWKRLQLGSLSVPAYCFQVLLWWGCLCLLHWLSFL